MERPSLYWDGALVSMNGILHNGTPAKIYTKGTSKETNFQLPAESEDEAKHFNSEVIVMDANFWASIH